MAQQFISAFHHYHLLVDDEGDASGIEFDAPDAGHALLLAEELVEDGQPVRLFEDGRSVGIMRHSASGYWTISPQSDLTSKW